MRCSGMVITKAVKAAHRLCEEVIKRHRHKRGMLPQLIYGKILAAQGTFTVLRQKSGGKY